MAPEMIPFNRSRRRRLLWFSLPVVLILLLISGKLFSLQLLAANASGSYSHGDGGGVVSAGNSAKFANVIEDYVAYFNTGDGYALSKDLPKARQEFEAALALAPEAESCKIRVNLELAIEKMGDEKKSASDATAAKALYTGALQVIKEASPGCFEPNNPGNREQQGQQLTDAKKRLEENLKLPTPPPAAPPPSTPPSTPPPMDPNQAKLNRLQQQQQQNQLDHANGAAQDQTKGQNPASPGQRRW